MVWQSTAPDGTKSVKDNRSILQDNTTYTKTTMNVDHFWDDATAGNDGHHQFVQMPKADVGGTPTDPSLASLMDGLFYAKELSATESVNNQDVKPFFINESAAAGATLGVAQTMQLLGIRAMCVFSVAGGVVTEKYKHNVTVTRSQSGLFTGTFGSELPTSDYLFLGASTYALGFGLCSVRPTTVPNHKTTTQVEFATSLVGAALASDSVECWFVIFGG